MMSLYLIILFFLITSWEMGVFNVFFGSSFHNSLIVALFYVVVLFFSYRIMKYRRISNSSFMTPKDFKFFSLVASIAIMFQVVHAIAIGPISSIKYSGYILFLYILVTQMDKKQFTKLCSIYVYFMTYLSLAVFLQILLLAFSNTPLSDFHSIKFHEIDFFRPPDFVMPYFLAYQSVDAGVTIGPLSFNRAIGLSSEPKYFSAMLWIALGISFINDQLNSRWKSFIVRCSLIIGLFFSMAYSSILLIGMAISFYLILRKNMFKNKYQTIIILFSPLIVSLLLTAFFEFLIVQLVSNSFAASRMDSFFYSAGGLNIDELNKISLLGTDITKEGAPTPSGVTMLLHWSRYGHIGFIFYLLPIIFLLQKSFEKIGSLTIKEKCGLLILTSTFIVYYQIFFSQPYTLLSCFLLACLYNLSNKLITYKVRSIPFRAIPPENG